MVIKKHNWMKYGGQGAEMLDIIVKDGTGRKIDSFKCNDKRTSNEIADLIWKRYGFFPSRGKNTQEELDNEVKEEIEHLRKHMEW